MTHKEPVKKLHVLEVLPDIGLPKPQLAQLPLGKTEFLIHLQSCSSRRKTQSVRMKRMRRKKIRNTVLLLLLLVVLCGAGDLESTC